MCVKEHKSHVEYVNYFEGEASGRFEVPHLVYRVRAPDLWCPAPEAHLVVLSAQKTTASTQPLAELYTKLH